MSQWLLRVVDLGIAAVIFIAPLFMGGRGAVGRLVLISFVCLAASAWAVRQCIRQRASWTWSGVEWLLLGGLLLVGLQLLPLPQPLLLKLSPAIGDILPLWVAGSGPELQLSPWSTISLTPEATRGGAVVYLSYAMLFLLIVQRVESLEDMERLLRWIALGAVAMATLGLLQLLFGNGKFLWVYEHPSRDTHHIVKGTFQNQNHFAHFLALGIAPLIWWIWRSSSAPVSWRRKTRWLAEGETRFGILSKWRSNLTVTQSLALAAAMVAFAGLLTFSRGGVIVLAVASIIGISIFVATGLLGKRGLAVVAALALLLGVALSIHGYQPLAGRLLTLRDSPSLEVLSRGRQALWSALLDGIPHFLALGSGIGSHREVYPLFMEEYFDIEFTHGESGYLPLLLETGLPGLALVLTGVVFGFTWCLRPLFSSQDRHSTDDVRRPPKTATAVALVACAGAIFPGLAASVVHSFWDFVWYIPACMSLTVILLACACRLSQLWWLQGGQRYGDRPGWLPPHLPVCTSVAPRLVWCSMCALVVTICTASFAAQLGPALAAPHWNRFQHVAMQSKRAERQQDREVSNQLYLMAAHLERALACHPDDARANLRMAAVCLRQFELQQKHATNAMDLAQIRDAALASRFPSREALDDWLARAIGENRQLLHRALDHCHRGLNLCPLQGEGYIYLTELSFLERPGEAAQRAYLIQAQKVRPHSGLVLFAAGKEAMLAGDAESALKYWKKAFHHDPEIQSLMIESLAAQLPADFFLEYLAPKLHAVARLYRHYRDIHRLDEARVVAAHLVKLLEQEAHTSDLEAAGHWQEAQALYCFLGNLERALYCQQQAVAMEPHAFGKRRRLAALLTEAGRYGEAVEQLQWCLKRRPDDPALVRELAQARRRSVTPQGKPPRSAVKSSASAQR